jgi:hypothetical protein
MRIDDEHSCDPPLVVQLGWQNTPTPARALKLFCSCLLGCLPQRTSLRLSEFDPPLDLTRVPQGDADLIRSFFGGMPVEAIAPDRVRDYQLHRRPQGFEAATINRETSALSRMFQLAIWRGLLERMPLPEAARRESRPVTGSLNITST